MTDKAGLGELSKETEALLVWLITVKYKLLLEGFLSL